MLKFLLLLFASFVVASSLCAAETLTRETVKIGAIVPLIGGLARRGQDISRLFQILEPKLNAASRRFRYQFIVEDGKCGLGSDATTAAIKLINFDKVKFLITGCSGDTLQAGPIAQRTRVLTIAVLSSHPDVRKIGDCVFRTYTDAEKNLKLFSQYILQKTSGKIALLTEEGVFTYGIRDMLLK
jgi:ABC-type branched-subunit amino acid transport system substrate-binding protein